jgi:hypothetical protein
MKTFTFVVTSTFAICFSITAFATTRTVSNNPNIPAQYSNLQTAIDDSAPGDTLLVHGSPNSYGNVTILKSMVINGPGYRPQGQNQLLASINSMTVRADAAGNVNNLVLNGLNINALDPHGGSGCGQGFAVKIRMERCVLGTLNPRFVAQGANTSELVAEQCIFTSTISGSSNVCSGPGLASILVTNCIFLGTFSYTNELSNGVVSNCLFIGGASRLSAVQNTIFSNNVFYGTLLSDANGAKTGCTFNTNLTNGTNNNTLSFGASLTSGTLENVDPLFINAQPPGNGQNYSTLFTPGQNFNPQAGSPLSAAGTDGTDIGLTGGNAAFDYLLKGIARGPWMTSLIISNATLPENGTLQVTFGAKAQD